MSWGTHTGHDLAMRLFALALLVAQLAISILILPASPLGDLSEPTCLATLASMITTLVLGVTRFVERPRWLDRTVLAAFLAGMPLVYTWCAILRGDHGDLAVEAIGIAIFGGAAVIGYLRAPALIGAGIIAHGLCWDSWHRASGYVPGWYAVGCLVVDLGIGAFALMYLAGPSRSSLIPRRARVA
jgi:hypothetical protein